MTKLATIPEESLSALWDRSRLLAEDARTNADDDGACEEAFELETFILRAPIRSHEDLIVKLRVIELAFLEEPRSDRAEGRALEQVLAWLAAHPTDTHTAQAGEPRPVALPMWLDV